MPNIIGMKLKCITIQSYRLFTEMLFESTNFPIHFITRQPSFTIYNHNRGAVYIPRLEDTRTLKKNTLSYVRIFKKIEHAYDTFRTANLNENSVSYTNISDIGHIGILMHYLFILEY
jgi:hypothetical protein